ncbi:serine protease [Mycolicibacterium hippocampi]|uniref:Serine protease n=1 Tax=Mycolicibacterium hippocampi TaxID=659824 RepID=A0A7I9ZUI8_9MYCO|nr:serine protease [Mycolicibacterium hippocampi]
MDSSDQDDLEIFWNETQEEWQDAAAVIDEMSRPEGRDAHLAALFEEINSPAPSVNRRVILAEMAYWFFSARYRSAGAADVIDKPEPEDGTNGAWTVHDFMTYLERGDETAISQPPPLRDVMQVLLAMERAGLLIGSGYDETLPIMGQKFVAIDEDPFKTMGELWLAEVFGAEITIPAYNSATVLITGDDEYGNYAGSGSGLVLDPWHVITNRHVVEKMRRNIRVFSPAQPAAALNRGPRRALSIPIHHSWIHYEPQSEESRDDLDVDVAIIAIFMEPMLPALVGASLTDMTFRNPRWGDGVHVFGYPRVPRTTDSGITVHSGTVVNPAADSREVKVERGEVVSAANETYPEMRKVFLYSATTRPGNSGGPIVGDDGRVIGLAMQDMPKTDSTDTSNLDRTEVPFYTGIPASEVVRAIARLAQATGKPDLEMLAQMETWA